MDSIFSWFLVAGLISFVIGGLVLLGIVLAPVLLLKAIFGKGGGSSSGSAADRTPQQRSKPRGYPTSFYTASRRLSDFNMNPDVYNFKTPTPAPNLNKLREPLKVDFDLAERLHLGRSRDLSSPGLDLDKARELFLPSLFKDVDEEDIEAS